jgi:methylated-DNA-[protein]-cysteine S-methyltransferase
MASPLGPLRLAAQGQALVGLWFADQTGIPAWAQQASPSHTPSQADGVLASAMHQMQAFLVGQRQVFDLPLRFYAGTPFQQAVWQALRAIPFGQTSRYSDIAAAIGQPQAVRAVGSAIGRNPLGIVIPCHRVVGKGGALTGYTGGLERKQALLALEARAIQGV